MNKRNPGIIFLFCALAALSVIVTAAAENDAISVTGAAVNHWNLLRLTEQYATAEYLEKIAGVLPQSVTVSLSNGQTAEASVKNAWTVDMDNSRWVNSVNLSELPAGTEDPNGVLNEIAVAWQIDNYTGSFNVSSSAPIVGQAGNFNLNRYMLQTDQIEFWQIAPDSDVMKLRVTQDSDGFSDDGNQCKYDISAWTEDYAGEWFGLYYFSASYWNDAYFAGTCSVSPKTYTVTLRPSGGVLQGPDIYQTIFVNGAYCLESVPPEPVRANYQFEGWYTEAAGGDLINLTNQTDFSQDTTL